MERNDIVKGLVQLGTILKELGKDNAVYTTELSCTEENFDKSLDLVTSVERFNNWFTPTSVRSVLNEIAQWLTPEELNPWLANYQYSFSPKNVALIMAGNLPLVGFHDVLCVLVSGNVALCKMSSDDKHLLPAVKALLNDIDPEIAARIVLVEGKMEGIEAVIATGSNNSQNYFQQYFSKYPHVFRGNRTSVAVLNGNETSEELKSLGKDIFTYFGLGCRNVSHLIVPKGYNFNAFFEAIFSYGDVINHYKYGNNYDYNRAVHLLNLINLLDNNFLLLRESDELHSPLAMLFYHTYESQEEINSYLMEHANQIQVVIGEDYTPFGIAQSPSVSDYADNFDTLKWMETL